MILGIKFLLRVIAFVCYMMPVYFRLDCAFGHNPAMEVICDVSQKEDHSQAQFSRLSPCWLEGRELPLEPFTSCKALKELQQCRDLAV